MKKTFFILIFLYLQFVGYSQNCSEPTSYTDLDINNISAGLLNGGDLWWNLNDSRYIAPKPQMGEPAVSPIFAGSIWMGGMDSGGNLKLAAQSYRQGGVDYFAGPIMAIPIPANDCSDWDQHFVVYGSEISSFIADFNDNGMIDDPVPANILKWPGSGNVNTFPGQPLPTRTLAPFFDRNMDNIYSPENGDYPILGLEGCQTQFADQMVWWVFNDIGNVHGNSGGNPIGVEVHAMAYAFTSGVLNNTTFYTYDIFNQSNDDIVDMYIGQWVDVDIGCWEDDFVGCDSLRSMGIGYNGGATDPDCIDFGGGGVPGYKNTVPLLGVDLLKGPKNNTGILPMTSFISYRGSNSGDSDPNTAAEHYNYLNGKWKDGSPVEYGGDGYLENTYPYPWMYPDSPNDVSGWSECSVGNAPADRRFIMGSGPFSFPAGGRNTFSVAIIFEPDVAHPCPDFTPLQETSDSIQWLFNNCFDGAILSNNGKIPFVLKDMNLFPNPTTNGQGIHITNVPSGALLEITTIDGKRLAAIKQESKSSEDIFWDLKTDRGKSVSPGLYFVSVGLAGIGKRVFKVSVF